MKKTILIVLVLVLGLAVEVANSDFTFGTPTNLGSTVNTGYEEISPEVSANELELFFSGERIGGYGQSDLWVLTRTTTNDFWGAPVNIGSPVNSSDDESGPSISADGLWLYFESDRPGGHGEQDDLWVSARLSLSETWQTPVNLGSTVNTSWREGDPSVSSNGLSLFFESNRQGGHGDRDLWVSTRPTLSDPWGEPANLGPTVNTSYYDGDPEISADGLLLFFNSSRPGGYGDFDIWVTKRATIDDDWGVPVNLGPVVNSLVGEGTPSLSADGRTLFYAFNPSGWFFSSESDIWKAQIIPIVDFDGDRNVDALDLGIMIDHWGENYPLCDIGPIPWGDGIVDVQDLIVLTKHLFEDYPLIAYWMLDETNGKIAYDSISDNNANCHGEPQWWPTGGIINGALFFDGIDDYISTPFILNPGKGSMGAFAWINVGLPGQVIISQTGDFGETWLGIDPAEGKLMTKFSGMYFGDLVSETIVTDGQWHHVGLVYDMDKLHRLLYVDGVMVAEDTTFVAGMLSDGGLYIGASKDLDAGSFFSGLIDDVRIYNVALSADEISALAQ